MFTGWFENGMSPIALRPVRGVAIRSITAPSTPFLLSLIARYGNEGHEVGSVYLLKYKGERSGGLTGHAAFEMDYVPLKRIEWTATWVGWLFALSLLFIFPAAIALIFGFVMLFLSSELDRMMVDQASGPVIVPLALLVGFIGAVLFVAAELWRRHVPERERAIREAIGDLTGYPIDPAIVREDAAQLLWGRFAGQCAQYAGINVQQATAEAAAMGIAHNSANSPARRQALLSLLHARVSLALGGDAETFERHSDALLSTLR